MDARTTNPATFSAGLLSAARIFGSNGLKLSRPPLKPLALSVCTCFGLAKTHWIRAI